MNFNIICERTRTPFGREKNKIKRRYVVYEVYVLCRDRDSLHIIIYTNRIICSRGTYNTKSNLLDGKVSDRIVPLPVLVLFLFVVFFFLTSFVYLCFVPINYNALAVLNLLTHLEPEWLQLFDRTTGRKNCGCNLSKKNNFVKEERGRIYGDRNLGVIWRKSSCARGH